MEKAAFPYIEAPFFGASIHIKLRELTQTQILSCGDFSLIETFEDKIYKRKKNFTIKEMEAYAERSHAIAKLSMVSPTYDELFKIMGTDNRTKEWKAILKELEMKLLDTPNGPKRGNLEEDIAKARILVDLILPEPFLNFVVGYALGIDKSDIKLLSEKALLEAAILAEKGHDNPSDHIDVKCSETTRGFYIQDINKRAWMILHEHRSKEKTGNQGLNIGS